VRLRSKVKRSPTVVISQISLCAGGQQGLDLRKIAFTSSVMEIGAAEAINARALFSLWMLTGHRRLRLSSTSIMQWPIGIETQKSSSPCRAYSSHLHFQIGAFTGFSNRR
jgi:hypothetical protein